MSSLSRVSRSGAASRVVGGPRKSPSVDELVARLGALPGWHSFRMDHGSGVMVCTRSG